MRAWLVGAVLLPLLPLALSVSGCLSDAEQRYNAGLNFHKQGRFEEAIAEYDQAIRLDPRLDRVYSARGVAYYDLGQYQRAIQDYDEAIRLDSKLAQAYVNRGTAYASQASTSGPFRTMTRPSGSTPSLPRPSAVGAGPTMTWVNMNDPSRTVTQPST